MARYRRRYYRRRYYRRYRKISENYFKVKAEAVGKIIWPANDANQPLLQVPGQVNASSQTFAALLENTTYINTLAGMFSFYRMTGLLIETLPDAANIGGNKIIENFNPVFIAARAGSNLLMNYGELKSINSGIMLDAINRQRKYTKFYGYYGDWINTTGAPTGAVSVGCSVNNIIANSPTWTVKFTFYLLYKKSKV